MRVERVVRAAPEPIADLAAAWFDVRHGEPLAGRAAFERMLDAFEQTMTFVALLGTVEYLQHRGEIRTAAADAVVGQLRAGRPLSTGFWWQLFDAVLTPFEHRANLLFVPELFQLRFGGRAARLHRRSVLDGVPELRNAIRRDHPAVGGVAVDLASVPQVRNRMRGHGISLPEHRYREVADEFAPELEALLDAVAFLDAYALAEVCTVEGEPGAEDDGVAVRAVLARRVGSTLRAVRFRQLVRLPTADARLGPGAVLLLRPEAGSGATAALRLDPFVVTLTRPDGDGTELAHFQGRQAGGGGLHHLGLRTGRFVTGTEHLPRFTRVVEVGEAGGVGADSLSLGPGLTLGHVRAASSQAADAFLDRATRDGVYVGEAYVERGALDLFVDEWLTSGERRALILAGVAGSGKSSFVCATTHRLRGGSAHVVLPVAATDLPAEPVALDALLAEHLGVPSLDVLLRGWARAPWGSAPPRVAILVDGVDRHGAPRRLFKALRGLVDRGLHVAVTLALPALPDVADELPPHAQLTAPASGPADGRAVPVGALTEGDARLAYNRYRTRRGSSPLTAWEDLPAAMRAAVRNPLLLRLACEAWDGRDVPVNAEELDIFIEAAERSLFHDVAAVDFVRHLVRRMVPVPTAEGGPATPRRSVPLDELLGLDSFRAAILSEKGPYRVLSDRGVLVTTVRRAAGRPAVPRPHVEFAFDAMLGYLVLAFDREVEPDIAALVDRYAGLSSSFAPAGFALDLALRSVDAGERAGLTERLLRRTDRAVGLDAAVRLLEWVDAEAPVSPDDLVEAPDDARPRSVTVQQRWWAALTPDARARVAELLQLAASELERVEGVRAERVEPPLLQIATAWLRSRLPVGLVLEVARMLAARGRALAAAVLAARIVRRYPNRLTPPQAREAALLEASGLARHGTDEALRRAVGRLEGVIAGVTAAERSTEDGDAGEIVTQTLRAVREIADVLPRHDPVHGRQRAADMLARALAVLDPDAVDAAEVRVRRAELDPSTLAEVAPLVGTRVADDARVAARLRLLLSTGDIESTLRDAGECARESGDLEMRARINIKLGEKLFDRGRVGEGLRLSREARELAEAAGRPLIVLDALQQEAYLTLRGRQDTASADELVRRHGRAAWALGEMKALQMSFRRISNLRADGGDDLGALEAARFQLGVLEALVAASYDVTDDLAVCHENLADYLRPLGQHDDAVHHAAQCVAHARGAELVWAHMIAAAAFAARAVDRRRWTDDAAASADVASTAAHLDAAYAALIPGGDVARWREVCLEENVQLVDQFARNAAARWMAARRPEVAAAVLTAALAVIEARRAAGASEDLDAAMAKLLAWRAYVRLAFDADGALEDADAAIPLRNAEERHRALYARGCVLDARAQAANDPELRDLATKAFAQAQEIALERGPRRDPARLREHLVYLRHNAVVREIRERTAAHGLDDRAWERLGGQAEVRAASAPRARRRGGARRA